MIEMERVSKAAREHRSLRHKDGTHSKTSRLSTEAVRPGARGVSGRRRKRAANSEVYTG